MCEYEKSTNEIRHCQNEDVHCNKDQILIGSSLFCTVHVFFGILNLNTHFRCCVIGTRIYPNPAGYYYSILKHIFKHAILDSSN